MAPTASTHISHEPASIRRLILNWFSSPRPAAFWRLRFPLRERRAAGMQYGGVRRRH